MRIILWAIDEYFVCRLKISSNYMSIILRVRIPPRYHFIRPFSITLRNTMCLLFVVRRMYIYLVDTYNGEIL